MKSGENPKSLLEADEFDRMCVISLDLRLLFSIRNVGQSYFGE
jgi:hypothetical protein